MTQDNVEKAPAKASVKTVKAVKPAKVGGAKSSGVKVSGPK
jgi:hypothetical protein